MTFFGCGARGAEARRWAFAPVVLAMLVPAHPASAQAVPTPNANQYGPQLIGAPLAWARGYTGTGITVVVSDSGIDPNHPAFAGKIDLARSRNYVLNAPGGAYDPNNITDTDAQSHGTHVAGIVASSAASGVPGIGYNAGLIVLRSLSSCATGQDCSVASVGDGTQAALNYYATLNNTFIYNASYGPNAPKGTTVWPASIIDPDDYTAALSALVKGKLIVAANGNDGTKSPVASKNPNGLALLPFVNPVNANAGVYLDGNNNYNFSALLNQPGLIIAVASVGRTKLIAPYSQLCGATASWCVSAPGGDQTNAEEDGIYSTLPNNTYGYEQGTSMAAPAVSGALAVLAQAYPSYSSRDWAYVLFSTAENVGGMAADNATYGYGLIRLDRATDGPTTLANDAAVDVGPQQATYWSQPLTTTGGFSKTGAGYLMIAGRTTATGDVAVNAGALGVGGTLTLQTQMTVAQGALLSGIGRIVGNTIINGTLDAGQLPNYADLKANNGGVLPANIPLTGTSPGTLTFQGNVTLTGTATMVEGIDGVLAIPGGPGTFDKVVVTGAGAAFTAGGTLTPVLRNLPGGNNAFSPAVGTTIVFVSAQNGATVTGQFGELTQPAAGLAVNTRLDVVYSATAITINVTPLDLSNTAAADGANKNVQAVAQALDVVRPTPGAAPRGVEKPVFDDLYDNSSAQDDAEYTSLSGEGQADNASIALNAFSGFSDAIGRRQDAASLASGGLQTADDGGAVAPRAALLTAVGGEWTAWIQGTGRWSSVGDDAGLPGWDSTGQGIAVGADRAFGDDLRAGVAFAYTHTSTDAFLEAATSSTYAGALYGSWTTGALAFDGRLALGQGHGETSRLVTVLGATSIVDGSYRGFGALLGLQGSYRIVLDCLTLEPFVGLDSTLFDRDPFTETSSVGLVFPSQTFSRVTAQLGTHAASHFDLAGIIFTPQVSVYWSHDAGDNGLATRTSIFGSPFLIDAADPGRDAANVAANLNIQSWDNLEMFVGYQGEFRNNETTHEIHGGIRVNL